MTTVGKCQLPQLLAKRGMTLTQLHQRTGLALSQLSDYANNRVIMGLPKAKLIADVLKVPIEALYEWND